VSPGSIAVLVSGTGRSLVNLAERIRAGELRCEIALVLSNVEDAPALSHARTLGLPTAIVRHADHASVQDFSAAVFSCLDRAGVDLAVLAGFLRLLELPSRWIGRVINIHPALLPAFGGKGFYGHRVHRAVLERGAQFTGATVHYVTNEYDAGPIILQRCIPVRSDDTVESLAARVFEEEKIALPQAIAMHLDGEVALQGGKLVRRAPRR
jgi:formyltetrahydrofolate-dependent phosphoribosylglycinamide formyltransferase